MGTRGWGFGGLEGWEIAPNQIYWVNTAAAFFGLVNWLRIRFIEGGTLTTCPKYIELKYMVRIHRTQIYFPTDFEEETCVFRRNNNI